MIEYAKHSVHVVWGQWRDYNRISGPFPFYSIKMMSYLLRVLFGQCKQMPTEKTETKATASHLKYNGFFLWYWSLELQVKSTQVFWLLLATCCREARKRDFHLLLFLHWWRGNNSNSIVLHWKVNWTMAY